MTKYFRLTVIAAACAMYPTASYAGYVQINLVSDLSGMATVTDPSLQNPWGISFSGTSPFWVSNQRTNTSTLYNALSGNIKQALTVNIPAGTTPPEGPTGQVFNSTTSDFQIPAPTGTVKSTFLFDTLHGTIEGWNPGSSGGMTNAEVVATDAGAVFTGLALASSGGTNYLYAADATGHIVVYDTTFTNVSNTVFAGKFVDPSPVAGFTPYNIQRLSNGNLFVTYAAVGPGGVPLPGGYVDEFDTSGNFMSRIATGGPVNTPWGLAIAPAAFGQFGGDLLVGNLFDSRINAFSLSNNSFVGSINVSTGFASPVGLWGLAFGNGTTGDANTLYFTAGINDQRDGLFGAIANTPEPASGSLLLLALAGLAGRRWITRKTR